MTGQMVIVEFSQDRDTWSGKTSSEPLVPAIQKDQISRRSSKKSSKSQNPALVCVCVPDKGWSKAGCYYADDGSWSIAWRTHDAQFWGVPQRRRRIALLADFNGLTAPAILFDYEYRGEAASAESYQTERDFGAEPRPEVQSQRNGVPGDFTESGETGQGITPGTESGADSAICLQGNGIDRADTAGCNGRGWRRGGAYTLNTIDRPAVYSENQGGGVTEAVKVR